MEEKMKHVESIIEHSDKLDSSDTSFREYEEVKRDKGDLVKAKFPTFTSSF